MTVVCSLSPTWHRITCRMNLLKAFVLNCQNCLMKTAKRFENDFGLSAYDARHLVEHRSTSNFFEACMDVAGKDAEKQAKPLANLIINDVAAYANAQGISDMGETSLTPKRAVELVQLLAADTISSKQAKEVFAAVLDEDKDPSAIVEERGMKQVSDTGAIGSSCGLGFWPNSPTKLNSIRAVKPVCWASLLVDVLKQMKGQGNPKVINEMLSQKLNS